MTDATETVFEHRLWTGPAPLAVGDEAQDVPKVAVYQPANPDGSAMVICPGGAYRKHGVQESEPVARWLNTLGITAILLSYRLSPRYQHPAPLLDVSRAIRTTRANAQRWKIDAKRVGVMGFSAGGHLAATVSTLFDSDQRDARDPVNQHSAAPAVSVLGYPVITFQGPSTHRGSRRNLLGDDPPPELIEQLSADGQVTPHTPPAFLFHTVSDPGVPVENAMLYAASLRKAGVPFEMHLFEPGRHGVGLATDDPVLSAWPGLCALWLSSRGFGVSKHGH